MATTTSNQNGWQLLQEWLTPFDNEAATSSFNHNPKLNAEIHSAIIQQPSEYVSTICGHLFTLYHDVKHRIFVLQFLPSFVTSYYDILYHHSVSNDTRVKDVCSTIDTFLVSLYNLSVTDDAFNEKIPEFRIPNLTIPSIYHTPNPDYYISTPLTQQAISKHEMKCEVIRCQTFIPFDTVNGSSSEHILYFLLIQYGEYISTMDQYSRQSYIDMSKKLLGQGYSFNRESLPLITMTGHRIHLSSRIMLEILGTLIYLKSTSSDNQANDCMHLLKYRAEYEMYADVILMTESMNYLHEFENQRIDSIGIEIESAPTIDLIRQKRSATTTRSMRNRQYKIKENEINFILDENNIPSELSSSIDEIRTNISSSIGPIASTPSSRHVKPVSLTSTDILFKNLQQQTSPTILSVRFNGNTSDDNETIIEQTHL